VTGSQPAAPEPRFDGEGNPIDDEPFRERVVDQWPLAVVLAGVAAGLAVLVWGDVRAGALVMGVAVIFGGALRLLLPRETAGLLVVRGIPMDLAAYGTLGIGLTVLALTVPPPA
jgi:hypothetical protein